MAKELSRLVLPKVVLRRLESAGVYCQTWLTAEKQVRANRWVLRAVESGGSSKDVGRYISFFEPTGERLRWLQKLDRVGGNGVHAVVVAAELVSLEMARIDQTYQLLIAHHNLGPMAVGKRPAVQSKVLFRGIDGHLSPDLLKQGLTPEFFNRAGEIKTIPERLSEAVRMVTAGVCCVNCRHCHGLLERQEKSGPPVGEIIAAASRTTQLMSTGT